MNTAFRFLFTRAEKAKYQQFRKELRTFSETAPDPNAILFYTTTEEKEKLEPYHQKTLYVEVPFEQIGRIKQFDERNVGIEVNPPFPGNTILIDLRKTDWD